MKILTNRKYKKMQDLIIGLQQDYNDLKDKQIDMQLELKYMQEQKELAEKQVAYLQNELRRANDIKKSIQNMATGGFVKGNSLFVEIEKQAKRDRKKKIESALFVEQKDGQYKLATEETIKNAKRVRKPRKEKEDGTKGKNVQKK